MENQIFREKSLERISSTEELRDYMRVTSPKLWMLLSVIIVLLAGLIVFSCVVTMENTIKVKADVSKFDSPNQTFEPTNYIEMQIPESAADTVKMGMRVRVEGKEGIIDSVDYNDGGAFAYAELSDHVSLLDDGIYDAEILLEAISPISFLIN